MKQRQLNLPRYLLHSIVTGIRGNKMYFVNSNSLFKCDRLLLLNYVYGQGAYIALTRKVS